MPVSTVVLIQPASSLTPTSTPAAQETPARPASATPEARMTVEQQKAYLDAHKIPYIVKSNGELQFDFMMMYTDTASIKVGHQETLGADLAAAAAEYDTAFPEPISSNPEDFYTARWYSATSEEQQTTIYAINIISNDFGEKNKLIEPIGAVFADIDGEQYAFMYMRALLTDPIEIAKNVGSAFVTFWIMDNGDTYTNMATRPEESILKLRDSQRIFTFSTIVGEVQDLANSPEIDLNENLQLYINDWAWHALRANLDNDNRVVTLQLKAEEMLGRLLAGNGFAAGMQDGLFMGGAIRPTDTLDRAFVESIPFATKTP
jgi:hypothetical protein